MRALFFALFAAMSFSLAAENVWTLGECDRRKGWALTSPDGKVTLRLDGNAKADLAQGVARLKGDKTSLVEGAGSVDLTGLRVKSAEGVFAVRSLRIGRGFLQDNDTVVSFKADNVDEIGAFAFCRARRLESVKLSGSARVLPDGRYALHSTIRRGVFSDCVKLSDLTLSLPIDHIGSAAFVGCTNLSADVGSLFSHDVKNVGAAAFSGCANLRGTFAASAVKFVGMCAFENSGIEDIRLGCASTLVKFAGDENSGKSGEGVFSPMPSLTNLEIRASSLLTIGASNLGHSPKLKRIVIDAPNLRSLGESRGSCRGLTALEVLDLKTPMLSNVGTGWPPFHDARSLKEVVWRAKPPPFSVLKRIFNGVPCVLNSAKEGKKCIIRVPAEDVEWEGLISPFELCERDYAPPSCVGALFASSRKAWVVRDKDL